MKETNLQPKENTMNKPSIHFITRSFFIMLAILSACLFSGCGDTPLPENHFGSNSSTGAEFTAGNSSGGNTPENSNSTGTTNEGTGGNQSNPENPTSSQEPHFLLGEGWKKNKDGGGWVQKIIDGKVIDIHVRQNINVSTTQGIADYAQSEYQGYKDYCDSLGEMEFENSINDLPPSCYHGIDLKTINLADKEVYLLSSYDGAFKRDYSLFYFEKEGKFYDILLYAKADSHLSDIAQIIETISLDSNAPDVPRATEEEWQYLGRGL